MLLPSMVRQGQFLVLIAASMVAGVAASPSQAETGSGADTPGHHCERASQDSFIREGCHAHNGEQFDEIRTVDSRKTLQQVSEDAANKSLILGDLRFGPISADLVRGRPGQLLAGLPSEGARPVLDYTGLPGSPYMLAAAPEYALTGFELSGDGAQSGGSLLLALNPSRVFVFNNRFTPGKHRGGESIRWKGLCQNGLDQEDNIMMDNEFQAGVTKTAVLMDCQAGKGRDLASIGNTYRLSSRSVGVRVKNGSPAFSNERFEYVGRPGGSATGIELFMSGSDYPVHISDSTFQGAVGARMTAIDLRQKPGGRKGGKITVSGNTFRGLRQGIRFSGYEEVQAGSVCNKWVQDGESSELGNEAGVRCLGYPKSGFVHFSDGVVCSDEWGTPEDIDDIDCEAESVGLSEYASGLEEVRIRRSYIVTPEDFEAGGSREGETTASSWTTRDILTKVVTPIGIIFYYGVGVVSRSIYAGASDPVTVDRAMIISWLFSTGIFLGYDVLKVLYQACDACGSYLNPHNIMLALYEGLFYSFPGDDYFKKYIQSGPAITSPAIVPPGMSPSGSMMGEQVLEMTE